MMIIARRSCTTGRQIAGQNSKRYHSVAKSALSSSLAPEALCEGRSACSSKISTTYYNQRFFSSNQNTPTQSLTPIKDPDHPSELYFHKLDDINRYAVTFLKESPSNPNSPSIIAYINYPSSAKSPIYQYIQQKPDSVETNPAFVSLLHDTMKKECVPQDGLIEYEAALRGSGWAHLNDQRHPLMPGRIATPENIIASVAFIDGELKPDSYEVNDVYRIVTGEEGFMDLRPTWLTFIKKRCEEVN